MHGLHVTLLVSAGLLLAGAAMALRLPRLMHCEPDETAPPDPAFAATLPPHVAPENTPVRMPAQRETHGSGVKV
ncbi:hypothetical protein STENM223S_01468 [Streptomyces tendae]